MNLLFLTEFGKRTGIGHLSRCRNLALSLSRLPGFKSYLFCLSKGEVPDIGDFKFISIINSSLEELGNYCAITKIDYIVCDLAQKCNEADLTIFSNLETPIITVDDITPRRLLSILNFYPPIQQVNTMDWSGYSGENLIGWPYYILSPNLVKQKNPVRIRKQVLISLGGSDGFDITGRLMKVLPALASTYELKFIIGPLSNIEKSAILEVCPNNIVVYKNPESLYTIMSQCDYAIVTYGVTVFELAYLQVPTVAITTHDDHKLSGESFWGSYNSTLNISNCSKNLCDEILAKMTLLESENNFIFPDFGENVNSAFASAIMEL